MKCSLPEISQYSPYCLPLNVLLLPKDQIFIFYCLLLGPSGFNWCFFLAPDFSTLFEAHGSPSSGSLLDLRVLLFLFIMVVNMIYLFVLDDSLTS